MIRLLFYFLIFLFLAETETAFFRALPAPFLYVSLVFPVGLYFYQHLGLSVGWWWILSFGFFLDLWKIGATSGETFFYALTAGSAIFLGQHFFTNRSFYGINACVFLSGLVLHLTHGIYFFLKTLGAWETFSWPIFLGSVFWSEFFSLLIVSCLFLFLGRWRTVLLRLLSNKPS